MTHRSPRFLLVAGAVSLAACADAVPTAPNDVDGVRPSELRGLNSEFTRLAQEIPGFGGMFYGADGRLNVYVAGGQSRHASVTRALQTRAGGTRILAKRSAGEELVVHDGDYDFAELSRLYEQMRPVLGLSGVVFTDIDESQNRLRIGVQAGTSDAEIDQALASYGVPREAVTVEITEPIVEVDASTLQERVQPFGGGLQLVFPNPMPGFVSLCTLGFNILRDAPGHSVNYFVTNSHCSSTRGVVDNTPYHQQPIAVLDPKQLIAIEVEDPPFLTTFPQCPYAPAYRCRYSDAAVAQYATARTPVRFGSIYRTAFFGTTANGSLVIDGPNPDVFTIADEAPFPFVGEVLDKVGRTTGWTRGPVIATCLDVGVSGSNIAMLCQDFVAARLAGGDSGSPVFQQHGDTKYATLYGILWGGGAGFYVMSAMENIRFELSDFQTH